MGLVPTGHRTRRCHGAERAERLMCESWVLPRQNSLKRKLVTGDNWVQQSISHSSTLPRGPGGLGRDAFETQQKSRSELRFVFPMSTTDGSCTQPLRAIIDKAD